ncbi:MAG: hypothetical protein E7539_05505 [Ruminococcaceae bacterium]|nr:hypothetical protein [Oscillospiraceae bacterium]
MKKTAWLLCLILCFSTLTSCSFNDPTSSSSGQIAGSETSSHLTQTEADFAFSLPFFKNDSLNPYSAKQSANFHLGTLLYDSLVTLNTDFSVSMSMAEKIVLEGNMCSVSLKKGLKFSDGSDVTLKDVAASYSAAKNSAYYLQRLQNVSSCVVKDNSVVFTLKKADRNFSKNLTFPIIKGGSNKSFAVGSGRYRFLSDSASDGLVLNEYNKLKKTSVEKISLVEIHKYSTLPDMIKIGSVNFVYADYSSDFKVASAKSSSVLMNNLVYLGVNSNNLNLANRDFRKALSLCLNRNNILSDAYAGFGFATASPFHPRAADLNSKGYTIAANDIGAANQLFAICGLSQKDESGFYTAADETAVALRLAVNKDNTARMRAAQSVKLNLEAAGIKVELIEENAADYKNRISSGDYDLFIGEVKLTADNNISSLLSAGALNACNDAGETLNSYNQYLSSEITLDDFLRTFDLNTPFIPLLYRSGASVFSATLGSNSEVTEYDVFADMANWKF